MAVALPPSLDCALGDLSVMRGALRPPLSHDPGFECDITPAEVAAVRVHPVHACTALAMARSARV